MKKCNSIHVVDVFQYDSDRNEYTMEHMDSTLYDYIRVNNDQLTQKERIHIVKQIIRGLKYIHSDNVFHRDISPHNMLIKKYDDLVLLKLADFGLSKFLDSQLTSKYSDVRGFFNDPALRLEGFENYNIAHEIYATTIVICYVMAGTHRIDNLKSDGLRSFVEKGTAPDKLARYQSIGELNRDFHRMFS